MVNRRSRLHKEDDRKRPVPTLIKPSGVRSKMSESEKKLRIQGMK